MGMKRSKNQNFCIAFSLFGSLKGKVQWRNEANCRPRPIVKVSLFPPRNLAYKNLKWKNIMF